MQQARWTLFCLALLGTGLAAQASELPDDDALPRIEASDIPASAPQFKDYPTQVFTGSHARLRLSRSDKFYQTRLRLAAGQEVNFAGHYILALWGCGYSCLTMRIMDVRTGKVLPTQGLGFIDFHAVSDGLLDSTAKLPGEGPVKFKADSQLLVLLGAPEEDGKREGINYYAVENGRIALVRHVSLQKRRIQK